MVEQVLMWLLMLPDMDIDGASVSAVDGGRALGGAAFY